MLTKKRNMKNIKACYTKKLLSKFSFYWSFINSWISRLCFHVSEFQKQSLGFTDFNYFLDIIEMVLILTFL